MARQLVVDVYKNLYHSNSVPTPTDDATATTLERQVLSNVFDNLPCLAKPKPKLTHDELDAYLATNIKDITGALEMWIKNCATFPRLSHMAIDYLSIPGKSSTHFTLWY